MEIISARARYEKLYPRNYQRWKIEAFLDSRKGMDENIITNLIALGDNVFEIEAAHYLGAQFTNAFIKTVKFRQSPSTVELIKQIRLITSQFQLVCTTPKNLTVRLLRQTKEETEKKAAEECDQATKASKVLMDHIK